MPREIEITKEFDGVSPKLFLKKKIDTSFNTLMKLIKDKRITLNGKKIKADSKLKKGDIIKLWKDDIKLREEIIKEFPSKDLNIPKIFEDKDFIILNKLPGVVVQGSQDIDKSLSLHLNHLKKLNEDKSNFQYFHVHRLDKDTSGILVCAKNTVSLRELNEVFRSREIKKTYLCLVKGELKSPKGKIEINLDRNPEGIKQKVKVVKNSGKKTLSFYKLRETYEYENETFSLVEVELKTGFMHQIRVHMKHLGNPIVCDTMYGNSFVNNLFQENNILARQFLHAESIEFKYNNKIHKFEADLTEDLKECLKILKKL